MPTFSAPDGTTLAFHVFGDGPPVLCLPGGMRASAYLGELGGLSAHRQLIMLDLRGTGESAIPADAASGRCDRLVDDVDALREHLGMDRMDLLAHSGGANLAVRYVERYPGRVSSLALITPSIIAVGLEITGDDRLACGRRRRAEPWFDTSFAALEALVAGNGTADTVQAIAPFFYGRWDEAAQAHQAEDARQMNDAAAAAFAADGAFAPAATRAALARFAAPVLVLAGEVDLAAPPRVMTALAALFPNAELVIQPGAGHFPWLDDPDQIVAAYLASLGATSRCTTR